MVDQSPTIRANNKDWKKTKQVLTEDRIRWAVNTFMPYKACGPDGIYPVCIQTGLYITIKNMKDVFRGSIAMRYKPI